MGCKGSQVQILSARPCPILFKYFRSFKIIYRNCPLCNKKNNGDYKLNYGNTEWPVIKCPKCNFIYLNKAPRYEELKENIAWEKSYYKEINRRSKNRPFNHKLSTITRWRLKMFPKTGFACLISEYNKPGRILDIGCGNGTKLSKLRNEYIPYGIEI